jgi:hypothetical protein
MRDPDLGDVSTATESGSMEVVASGGVVAPTGPPRMVPVDVCNPLSEPYRTGSYLICDIQPGQADHFRKATELQPNPYRASGSRQLDADQLTQALKNAVNGFETRDLFLVDLREESHGFIDGIAVSWYADNDFGNVGMTKTHIERDERARLGALQGETAQIFAIKDDCSDNRRQQREMPVSYETFTPVTPVTERALFDKAQIGNCTVHYWRIPITDHCAPSTPALAEFRELVASCDPESSWVHFHCHGGDGRTTTFLALYDMMSWHRRSKDPFPALEVFARRQYGLHPNYCLNPDGCGGIDPDGCYGGTPPAPPIAGWKRPLAVKRWAVLKEFHDHLCRGLSS